MRDTCHRNRAHMNTLKYQRSSRNWNTGRLTYPYQMPAGENVVPLEDAVAYQVLASSAR
jgi:hypothetical protein